MSLLEQLESTQLVQSATNQLCRLPVELRTVIYELVFQENVLHFRRYVNIKERELPYCFSIWCVDNKDSREGYYHRTCYWFDRTKKHMLGLPLVCRQLYTETIQYVYSRHTFHMQDDLFPQWCKLTPKIHIDAVTSLRFTTLTAPAVEDDDDEDSRLYRELWGRVSALPNLKSVFAMISWCETNDEWTSEILQKTIEPIKKVQQQTLCTFDLIFSLYSTWFPEDCYLKIDYNQLEWETCLIDLDEYPVFQGTHSCIRVVGMNGFLGDHRIHNDMPTASEVIEWIDYFTCNPAFGDEDPEGYDWKEIGESARNAHETAAEEDIRLSLGQKMRHKLDIKYTDVDDPLLWDIEALNKATDLTSRGQTWKWRFPEKPSWIKATENKSEDA